ncbi:MAG: substrate-binding periplasmic protein [Rhizobiaceae bacterium]
MNTLLLSILFLFVVTAAQAQNCSNIKSGLNANQKPQNTSRDLVGQSLDDIVDRGWIMFAVYENFAPYAYENDSKLTGIDIDVGKMIAKEFGVEARFYAVSAGENVDADLRFNVWSGPLIGDRIANVMLHIPYNRELACRNEQVVLNGQYYNERVAIAYSKEKYPDGGPTPAYFRFDTVGVENDTISDFYLSGIRGGQVVPQIRRFQNYEQAMLALKAREIDAVMGPLGQLEHGLIGSFAVHTPPLPGLGASQWTLGVAVRHNWRPLSYAVDDVIRAAIEDGRMKAIFESHGLTYTPPEW